MDVELDENVDKTEEDEVEVDELPKVLRSFGVVCVKETPKSFAFIEYTRILS